MTRKDKADAVVKAMQEDRNKPQVDFGLGMSLKDIYDKDLLDRLQHKLVLFRFRKAGLTGRDTAC